MGFYRMYFICDAKRTANCDGPDLQFFAETLEHAVEIAQVILTDLEPDDPAVAYCIVNLDNQRIVHSELCGRKRAPATAHAGPARYWSPARDDSLIASVAA